MFFIKSVQIGDTRELHEQPAGKRTEHPIFIQVDDLGNLFRRNQPHVIDLVRVNIEK